MSENYVEITEDESELGKILCRDYSPTFRKGFVRFGQEKSVIPKRYLEFRDAIDNMEIRNDDIWLITHPKTGTTWSQEMIWCIANDLDFVGAEEKIPIRFPCLETTCVFDIRQFEPALFERTTTIKDGGVKTTTIKDGGVQTTTINDGGVQTTTIKDGGVKTTTTKDGGKYPSRYADSVQHVTDLKSPRFIKSHLPWQMLPKQLHAKKPKIIYVARNAKDTCLSYFHFSKHLNGYTGSYEDFTRLFLGETLPSSPFWSHVLSFWKHRDDPNILFLKFEDMKKDLPSVIRQTADFLGKTLTDAHVDILADHLSFANMKKNPAVNYANLTKMMGGDIQFMRHGGADQWKTDMSPELILKFDQWTKECTEGTGLIL